MDTLEKNLENSQTALDKVGKITEAEEQIGKILSEKSGEYTKEGEEEKALKTEEEGSG